MNNKAFTLIELMIVVAVLGIMAAAFSTPASFFMKRTLLNGQFLEEKRVQAIVFYCMKHFLEKASVVKSVTPNTVTFSNNRKIEIVNADHKILFFDGKHKRIVHYGKSIKFSAFKKIDYMTFGCYMSIGRAVIPMFWRSGGEKQ